MATITLQGNEIHTSGDLPNVGAHAPECTLTDAELNDVPLSQMAWSQKS